MAGSSQQYDDTTRRNVRRRASLTVWCGISPKGVRAEARDISALIGLLDPGATATADGGGLASAHPRPIEGGEQVARLHRNRPRSTWPDDPGAHGPTASPAWSLSKTA
jgi:hypothetical protein